MAAEFLKADIAELQALRAKAIRVRSQAALDAALAGASAALADLPEVAPEAAAAEVADGGAPAPEVPAPVAAGATKAVAKPPPPPPTLAAGTFVTIGTFGFDAGGYDSPWVRVDRYTHTRAGRE
jgi:hypothetical protein